MVPSADIETLSPNLGATTVAAPVWPIDSLGPCWVHVCAERVNTHAAPRPRVSENPPANAVFPSPDSATLWPKLLALVPPGPSFGP